MPVKISDAKWARVRDRMTGLMTEGVVPLKAAMQTSRELGGQPAPGTIMNRMRRGWVAPSVTGVASELRELKAQLRRALDVIQVRDDAIAERDKIITALNNEMDGLRERAARAEGVSDVLREVASMDELDRGPQS